MTGCDLVAAAKPWMTQAETVKVIYGEFYDQVRCFPLKNGFLSNINCSKLYSYWAFSYCWYSYYYRETQKEWTDLSLFQWWIGDEPTNYLKLKWVSWKASVYRATNCWLKLFQKVNRFINEPSQALRLLFDATTFVFAHYFW